MTESKLVQWFGNQSVFITGATGFMGKIMVEKLLRSCPEAKIYVLIRAKKGKTPQQRLNDFLECPVFENLRMNSNHIFNNLICINGDVTQKNCGISDKDFDLLKRNITVVFHMAANVRFDQPLKTSIKMNTGGTLNILNLACNFEKLKVFTHVSTSYCHCHISELEEKLYKSPQDPLKMLDLVEWLDETMLEQLTPTFLNGYPNTYAYTKCLTEQLVSDYSKKLPIVIARPSIVVAAYKEPIEGWVDNLNGPTGIMMGAGKGVIRSMHCNIELLADIVPVDMVINALLIYAWKMGNSPRSEEADVYHITANEKNSVSWGEALELGKKFVFDFPFSTILWYPGGSPKSNYFIHSVAAFFFHFLPAYFIDFMLAVLGYKTFMVNTHKRIENGLKVLTYYTTRPWHFQNEKLYHIYDCLDEVDRKIFYTNQDHIDKETFMLNYVLGTRKYCAKEDMNTLPKARKLLRRLYYLDVMKNVLLCVLLLWVSYLFILSFA